MSLLALTAAAQGAESAPAAQSAPASQPAQDSDSSVASSSAADTSAAEMQNANPPPQAETLGDLMDLNLAQLLELDYGSDRSPVELHAYLNSALWAFGSQAWGDYANTGSSLSGHPAFVSYSGYIDVRGRISTTLLAEAEFELYKGETGEFKVCRLRGVWRPVGDYFQLAVGRDFPPIGLQDKVYYPTSKYRMIANAPYLYWSILRATGWWDSGLHASGSIPLSFLTEDTKILWNVSVINGPGDVHQEGDNYLNDKLKPNADGYMYEGFHNKARQPWDNNWNKMVPVRLAVVPIKNLELGASFMIGRYDKAEKYDVAYYFAHALYGGERLTIAAEYGQIDLDVNKEYFREQLNTDNGTYDATLVSQQSAYISAGYKILLNEWNIHYFEPVVRYEFMDSWAQDKTNLSDRHAVWAGVRFSPTKGWVIKGAYLFQFEPYGPELDNNGFVLEAVFDF